MHTRVDARLAAGYEPPMIDPETRNKLEELSQRGEVLGRHL
jgi:hypothetical protein